MPILIYSVILLAIAIAGKAMQTSPEYYFENDFLYDLPLILFSYFGIVALWCRMRQHRCGPWWFWKLYALALVISTLLVPFFDDTMQKMIEEYGMQESLISFGFTFLLLVPYYLGVMDFAFRHKFYREK